MSDNHEIAFVKFEYEGHPVYVRADMIVGIVRRWDKISVAWTDDCLVQTTQDSKVYTVSKKSLETMKLVVLTAGEAGTACKIMYNDIREVALTSEGSETTDYMGIEFEGVKNPKEFSKGLNEAPTGEGSEK